MQRIATIDSYAAPRAMAIVFVISCIAFPDFASAEREWTFLFYGAGAYERQLVRTLGRIQDAFVDDQGIEFVALVDRTGDYEDLQRTLGLDWIGTRLYRVERGGAVRLEGGEDWPNRSLEIDANVDTSDPRILRSFIRFGKERFPARRYALIFFGHGSGYRLCIHQKTGAALQPTEISSLLERKDSVDLVIFDVCYMSCAEIAYQWRPGNGGFQASAMVAAPGLGDALPYERILPLLDRRAANGIDPANMQPLELGRLIVAETDAHRREQIDAEPMYASEALACCDLTKAACLKRTVDALAAELAGVEDAATIVERLRGSGTQPVTMNYLEEEGLEAGWAWIAVPYFDLYDLAGRIRECPDLPESVRSKAKEVQGATDDLVVASFGQKNYAGFEPGRNGVYVTFPDGDAIYKNQSHWERCSWYTPLVPRNESPYYGRWAWCADQAAPANGRVENWFELLDSWFDRNDMAGGSNGYLW